MEPKEINDEIDLRDLALSGIRYLQKNFLSILWCVLIGIGLGGASYVLLPNIFESKMILLSDILNESYSEQITEDFNKLAAERSFKTIASRLSLREEEARKILQINIQFVKTEKSDKNENKDKYDKADLFVITVKIKDNSILDKLQNGIIEFLRTNQFAKIRVQQRKEMYMSFIKKLGIEIRSLDSLKARLFKGQPVYSKLSEMLLVDPTNIYTQIVELNKEKIKYQNDLELVDSIQLIEGFTPFEKPVSPRLMKLLTYGLIGGVILSVLLLSLRSIKKELNSVN